MSTKHQYIFLQKHTKGQRYILHTLEYCHEGKGIRMENEKKGNEMNHPVNEQVRPKRATLRGQ